MPLRTQPDATVLLVAALKAHPELQALISQRVSADIPPAPTWPRVQVTEVTGRQVLRSQLRETVVDVASWADTRPQASTVAAMADAVLMTLVDSTVAGEVISYVRVVTPPVWQPDPESNRARYIGTYGVIVHPQGP